jgi:hypothetical protein
MFLTKVKVSNVLSLHSGWLLGALRLSARVA